MILNTAGAAEALGCSPKYVRTLVARGKLRPIPGGHLRGCHLFDSADVEALKAAPTKPHAWAGKAVPPKRPRGVQ